MIRILKSFLSVSLIAALFSCGKAGNISGPDSATAKAGEAGDSALFISPNTADSSSAAAPRPLTVAFVGDIMMGTTFPAGGHYLTPDDGASLFKDTDSLLCAADIAAGNLEGSLFDGEGTVKKCNDPSVCFAFKMPSRYARHLADAGFDFVGIANNHINDFGQQAISSTRQALEANGVAYAGLRASCPTAVVERDGRKIGFAAFGHSMGTLSIMDFEEVERTVKGLRDSCDFVIVSFHGGGEGTGFQHVPHAMEVAFGEKRGDVEKFAHAAIDAGADIVFGHGPHVNRALELYKGHLIAYSLGNFCTPYRMGIKGVSGYAPVLTATLNPDGTLNEGRIHSFIQQRGKGPLKDPTNAVAKNIRSLTLSDFPSTPLTIEDNGLFRPSK